MMACQLVISLFLFIPLVLATSIHELRPLPRSPCPRSDRKVTGSHGCDCPCGDDTNKTLPEFVDVDLKEDEQLLWTSPNGTERVAMSFTMKPYPGQRVIDMERFTKDTVTVVCSEDMVFEFGHVGTFERAMESWDWVNKDQERAFILVGDPVACKSGNARDPWLVTGATFDVGLLTIRLTAAKKEWTEVTYEYKIDYGAVETNLPKRFLDYSWGEPFEVPLTTPFRERLITFDEGVPGVFEAKFFTNCYDCGLFGRLLFEGHIAGNIFQGVTRLDLSVLPRDIHVDLNLEVLLSGYYDGESGGPSSLGQDFNLLNIPLPASWTVPGILALGPYAQLQAGFAVKYFEGNGRLATGGSLRVPDDSFFRVDFLADKLVTANGWKPDFQVKPLEAEAEGNAVLNLHLGISPSIDLVLFNQRGLVAGFPFKFLSLDVDVKGGYSPAGFCPNDKKPYGLSVDSSLGAELSVQVIERKAGIELPDMIKISEGNGKVLLFDPNLKKKISLGPKKAAARSLQVSHGRSKRDEVIFEETVLDLDNPLKLPTFCKSFGKVGEPVCRFVPEPEDQEWYDTEIADAQEVDSVTKRRRRDVALRRRAAQAPQATRGERVFRCGEKTSIQIRPYPGPSLLVHREEAGTKVPIMVPKMSCKETNCTPDKWDVRQWKETDDPVIPKDATSHEWSTDHIYEINWVTSFWNHVAVEKGLTCSIVLKDFKVEQGGGVAEEMLRSIGNMDTYKDMMLLYPIIDNGMKHRIFSKSTKRLAAKFYKKTYTAADRACAIGRIVSSCKYMNMEETKKRLQNTLKALDAVFVKMDKDEGITKPYQDGKELKYEEIHKEWFTELYHNGTRATRETLIEYAKYMMEEKRLTDFNMLPKATRDAITKIASCASEEDCLEFCPDNFEYPSESSSKSKSAAKPPSKPPSKPSAHPSINPGPFWIFKLLANDGRSYSQTPSKLYSLNPALLAHDLGGNGIQTNTECVRVSDTVHGVEGAYLRKGDSFYFGWEKEGDTREFNCLLQVHGSSVCRILSTAEGTETYNPGDAAPGTFPFDVFSWQVTNCAEMVKANTGEKE